MSDNKCKGALTVLDDILAMHEQTGIKLMGSKSHIFPKEVEYLWHVVVKDDTNMKEVFI